MKSVKNQQEECGRRIFDGDLRARRMDKSLPFSAAAAISYVF